MGNSSVPCSLLATSRLMTSQVRAARIPSSPEIWSMNWRTHPVLPTTFTFVLRKVFSCDIGTMACWLWNQRNENVKYNPNETEFKIPFLNLIIFGQMIHRYLSRLQNTASYGLVFFFFFLQQEDSFKKNLLFCWGLIYIQQRTQILRLLCDEFLHMSTQSCHCHQDQEVDWFLCPKKFPVILTS